MEGWRWAFLSARWLHVSYPNRTWTTHHTAQMVWIRGRYGMAEGGCPRNGPGKLRVPFRVLVPLPRLGVWRDKMSGSKLSELISIFGVAVLTVSNNGVHTPLLKMRDGGATRPSPRPPLSVPTTTEPSVVAKREIGVSGM